MVWDNGSYSSFLTGEAPETVHPSLWRQSTLVARQGLFEVTDGIYQVRGYDLSNMSVIEGDTGIIVIDPLISTETAAAVAPGTEAPAEMHFYFPDRRALCMAENATHTLHNLLTLRGALVRDPHVWARYLTEAIELFAGRSDVVFASHHWPTCGTENIIEFLSVQRDLYAYLHDQTLRLLNQGYTVRRPRHPGRRAQGLGPGPGHPLGPPRPRRLVPRHPAQRGHDLRQGQ